jgi:hypothetical protein
MKEIVFDAKPPVIPARIAKTMCSIYNMFFTTRGDNAIVSRWPLSRVTPSFNFVPKHLLGGTFPPAMPVAPVKI